MKLKYDAIIPNKKNEVVAGLDKPLSRLSDILAGRLECALEILNSPFAGNRLPDKYEISDADAVGLLRINYFLCESLSAVKRLWNTMPREFQIYVGCPGEPPDGYHFARAHRTQWEKDYKDYELKLASTHSKAPFMAQSYTTQMMIRELNGWLALIFAYRSLLPYVTPSLDYLSNLAALDPLLALPNYETIAMVTGREIGDYKVNLFKLFKGRDELFVYFDVVSPNPNVMANGPIAGSISAPLFDSKDLTTGKRNDWAQIRYVLKKLDGKIERDADEIAIPKLSAYIHGSDANIYWAPDQASDRLSRVPIECIFMVTAPEFIQRWFSYVVKMGKMDPRNIPCKSANMTDVKTSDLVAISKAFTVGDSFNFDATPKSVGGMRHHVNFANAALVAQNALLVERANTLVLKGRELQCTPMSDKSYHRVWEKSWSNAFVAMRDMVDATQYSVANKTRLLRALDVANTKALLGFGTGVFGAIISAALIYGGKSSAELLSTLESRAGADQLAKFLGVWVHSLSRKGVQYLNATLQMIQDNPHLVTLHPSFHREYDAEAIDRSRKDVFDEDIISERDHQSKMSGFSDLSTRSQMNLFFNYHRKPETTELETTEGKRKAFSFLSKLF